MDLHAVAGACSSLDALLPAATAAGATAIWLQGLPSAEDLQLVAAAGLRAVIDLGDGSPADTRDWARAATREAVIDTAAALRDNPAVVALVLGGPHRPGPSRRELLRLQRFVMRLAEDVRRVAPGLLLTYRSAQGSPAVDTAYLDFDLYQVDAGGLPSPSALARLHLPSLDRPVVLALDGHVTPDAVRTWQVASLEAGFAGVCVPAGGAALHDDRFQAVVRQGFAMSPLDLRDRWPRISVVVCAYQAAASLDRCLSGIAELRYPDFETIVVDDGSTDETVPIARNHDATVIEAGRNGLSGARNIGLEAATGEIVAYLDSDAWPDPDWLTYIALAFEPDGVVAAGGPNLPPPDDPQVAQCVSRAAGGPSPVLISGDRAEIVPGCNLAVRASSLRAINGFDPTYRTAGDDVDVCWRLAETQGALAYHHGAMVWHQRRASVRGALRQQRGYGTAEVALAHAHPDRFTALGVPILSGEVQGPHVPGSQPRAVNDRMGLLRLAGRVRRRHMAGAFVVLTVLGVRQPRLLAIPALLSATIVGAHLLDGVRTARRERVEPTLRSGLLIGLLNLLLPFPRTAGRLSVARTRLRRRGG